MKYHPAAIVDNRLNQTTGYRLSEAGLKTVYHFLSELPAEEVIEAMNIACAKIIHPPDEVFRYFCGICWNKIKFGTGSGVEK